MRHRFLPLGILTACLWLVACSSGPTKSMAEQQYDYARGNLDRMEYTAALKNIDEMISAGAGGPLEEEGRILSVVLQAAMAEAAKEMGEAYEYGLTQPAGKARYGDFVNMRSSYYGMARVYLLDSLQELMKQRGTLAKEPLKVQIRFPDFTGTAPPALSTVRSGTWVEEGTRFQAEKENIRNAFARTVARLVGAGDDIHKGHATFDASAQFDPRVYLVELSAQLLKVSEIFEPRALSDMRYRRTCLEVIRDNMDLAQKLLETTPDKEMEKRVKDIKGECEKLLKKIPAG